MICTYRTKIISAFERNGSRIQRFRRSERNDVNGALLKWLKQQRNDNAPLGRPLLMKMFFLYKFWI